MYRIGVDVGGTNTDCAILDIQQQNSPSRGVLISSKIPTTVDITSGITHVVEDVLQKSTRGCRNSSDTKMWTIHTRDNFKNNKSIFYHLIIMAFIIYRKVYEIEAKFFNNFFIKFILNKTKFFNIYNNNYKIKLMIDICKKANIFRDINYI
jgi:hypothetical protein